MRLLQAALAILGALIAGVLTVMLWISAKVQVHGDISSLLQERDIDSYRVSMAHFLDLTPQAFATLRLPSALAAVAFLFGFGTAWWLRRKNRPLAATICTAIAMAVFLFAANIAFGVFSPYLSSGPLVKMVLPQIRQDDVLVLYGEYDGGSSVAFYSNRQLLTLERTPQQSRSRIQLSRRATHFFDRHGICPALAELAPCVFIYPAGAEGRRGKKTADGGHVSGSHKRWKNCLCESGRSCEQHRILSMRGVTTRFNYSFAERPADPSRWGRTFSTTMVGDSKENPLLSVRL